MKNANPILSAILILLTTLVSMGCSKDDATSDTLPEASGFQGNLAWIKNFGGSGEETPRSLIPTKDGGLAILGFTNSTDGDLEGRTNPVNDYWVLKIDADGNLEWNRTFGGSKDDRGQALIQTADGGYALTGYAMSADGDASANSGFHDNWVVKLDASGNMLWERSFGFSGHDHSYDILETRDGGLLSIGFLDLTAARADGYEGKSATLTRHGVGEYWATKLDAEGNLVWRYYFGGSNNDRAHAVSPSPDGGFVMAGFSESADYDISDPRGSYDFWVVKVDGEGRLQWEENLGGSGIDIASDLVPVPGGGYLVTGHTFSTDGDIAENKGESDVWVVCLNEEGDFLWENTYGGTAFDAAESIAPTKDGGFLIGGNTRSSWDGHINYGENDLFVLKIDATGNTVWDYSLGGRGVDLGFDAVQHPDGAVYMVGELAGSEWPGLTPLGNTDLVLLKFE